MIKDAKNPSTFDFVFTCIYRYRWLLLGQATVAIIFAVDLSVRPYILKRMLDSMTLETNESVYQTISTLALFYIGMSLCMSLAYRFHDYLWLRINPGLKRFIGYDLMTRMMDHSHRFYQDNFAGSLSNKIKDVMSDMPDLLKLLIQQFFAHILALVVAIVTLAQIDVFLSIFLFIWASIFIIVITWAAFHGKKLSFAFAEARSTTVGSMVDSIGNIMSIRLFAAKKYELKNFKKHLDHYVHSDRKESYFWLKVMTFQGLSFVCYQAICLFYVVKGYQSGHQSAGDLALVLTINMAIVEFLWNLARDITTISAKIGTISQGLKLVLTKLDIQDSQSAKDLRISRGEIQFNNVEFNYHGAEKLFTNKSLLIKGGEKIGLVGYSGSGKTTFVNLILRLFDIESGEIYIDDQNIAHVTQQSLHRAIGMIPQDPILFHRSLLDNILYGRADASFDDVVKAAKKAHAHEFIMQQPSGYHTLVGERGIKLSGGQRQRMAIARAILKDAPILILDEATSQLDSITERKIQTSLYELMENKTTIVIAHRLSTLKHMDRIIVFDKGRIIEDGTHEQLIARDHVYKSLWYA